MKLATWYYGLVMENGWALTRNVTVGSNSAWGGKLNNTQQLVCDRNMRRHQIPGVHNDT